MPTFIACLLSGKGTWSEVLKIVNAKEWNKVFLITNDFEIALNFASGTGKEHMALMEAILELGLNFRLVTLKNGEVEVMGMER